MVSQLKCLWSVFVLANSFFPAPEEYPLYLPERKIGKIKRIIISKPTVNEIDNKLHCLLIYNYVE